MVDFLRKTCGFDYTEEEIFRVIGILRTNAFHIQVKVMVDLLSLIFNINNERYVIFTIFIGPNYEKI